MSKLSRAERALLRADRSDVEEQRVETIGAVAAVVAIVAIFAVPAIVSLLGGWASALTWIGFGLLGATPLYELLRRNRVRRRLARNPLPPPRPTTRMWLESAPPESDVRKGTA